MNVLFWEEILSVVLVLLHSYKVKRNPVLNSPDIDANCNGNSK